MSAVLLTHYKQIRRVLILVLVLNWAVAAAKIIYGLWTQCVSMTADGFHSLADGTSNIIGLLGIMLCAQPIDEDHPYGHKKYETLFALGIAALLGFVAFGLAKEGIHRLFHRYVPSVDALSFVIMVLTMGVNVVVMKYETRQGKRLGSDILLADAAHTRADILTSLSVIASLVAIKLGYPIVDPIVTIAIALFIAHEAWEIARSESAILCDATAISDTRKIEEIVLKIPGVLGCHKIRSRGRLDDIHVDLHIEVAPSMPLGQAHNISDIIEEAIQKQIPSISDVLVHVEPQEKA